MNQVTRAFRAMALLCVFVFGLTGCLSMKSYVDSKLPIVGKSDIGIAASSPAPVHVLFEFRTKGNSNARATAEIKPRVIAVASESGLFSNVSTEGPRENGGGVLTITIDNVPLTDDAAAKGFGTGLTMGLVGTMVTDGYVANASYSRSGKTTQVSVKHALHTTVGNASGPAGLQPMDMQTAVHQVMDQLVWNSLKELREKHAFD